MTPPPMGADADTDALDSEISLVDLVDFLRAHFQQLLLGLLGGLLIGALGGWFLSGHRAEIVLDNSILAQTQTQTQTQISYPEWTALFNALPALATQLLEKKRLDGQDLPAFQFLKSPQWWSANVKPIYAADKNTTKELGSVPDSMKGDFGRILQVRITAEAKTPEEALSRAHTALDFLRNAGIFLKVGSLFEIFNVEAIRNRESLETRRVQNGVESAYIQRDIDHLVGLIARNTQEITDRVAAMNRVVNESSAGVSGAKSVFNIRGAETPEIPLDARLNELKLALHQKEIERLRISDEEAQVKVLEAFIDRARPLVQSASILSGEALLKDVLAIESTLRSEPSAQNPVVVLELDSIRSALTAIRLKLVNQLPVMSQSTERQGRIRNGLLGGGFGGLMLVLLTAALSAVYRSQSARLKPKSARPALY